MLPETQSVNEERVYTYLKTMIGNMSINVFFWFVTGSSICSSGEILVTYLVWLEGLLLILVILLSNYHLRI